MLILLPPSKGKHPVRRGKPVDVGALSFPSLTATREAVLDGLIEVSGQPDATTQLGERDGVAELIARNTALRELPTAEAGSVYGGVVYEGLGLADLDAAARRRARAWIVVVSALWGPIHLTDRIPPYRLDMCGRLPGLPHLPQHWRPHLEAVLPDAARKGLVVDCRSAEYAAAWRPSGKLAERTLVVRVLRPGGDGRSAPSYGAKYTRGVVARQIVRTGADPRRPEALIEALSPHLEVSLAPPPRPGGSPELRVVDRSPAAGGP